MTLLSDFFIATDAEAAALDINKSPAVYLPSMLATGVGVDELKELDAILVWELARLPPFPPETLGEAGDEDYPLIVQVPVVISDALAGADAQQLGEWAAAWAEATGWTAYGVSPDFAVSLVREMAAMARDARLAGRSMYVWLCESL